MAGCLGIEPSPQGLESRWLPQPTPYYIYCMAGFPPCSISLAMFALTTGRATDVNVSCLIPVNPYHPLHIRVIQYEIVGGFQPTLYKYTSVFVLRQLIQLLI